MALTGTATFSVFGTVTSFACSFFGGSGSLCSTSDFFFWHMRWCLWIRGRHGMKLSFPLHVLSALYYTHALSREDKLCKRLVSPNRASLASRSSAPKSLHEALLYSNANIQRTHLAAMRTVRIGSTHNCKQNRHAENAHFEYVSLLHDFNKCSIDAMRFYNDASLLYRALFTPFVHYASSPTRADVICSPVRWLNKARTDRCMISSQQSFMNE